ncbi:hypothetical protein LS684_04410 [Cytobacillus spongiae]|uniref:hypothetical protein n=1 Tax=Cytobacillus spongiae TaxID=2901381 RepID=UPI001F4201E3|nr:hypothetical protein [Cytobacillus spongiae]UII56714.1 hypothetical protein LS684_04410 [Cytobacillus spongiae]
MAVEIIELKDMEIVEVDGEFKPVYKNEIKIPCFLTNYALKVGKDLGMMKSSLAADLLKLQGIDGIAEGTVGSEVLNSLDEVEMQKIIYLGCIGANPTLDMDFDKFLKKYHYKFEDTAMIYLQQVTSAISKETNKFVAGLQSSTKKGKKK